MIPSETTECPSKLMTETMQVLLSDIATTYGVNRNELLHRALQQLSRFSDTELQDKKIVSKEIERCAQRLKGVKRKYQHFFEPSQKSVGLRELSFRKVPKSVASIVNRKFHYIGYNRSKSIYLGFFLDDMKGQGKLVSMITLSPFDLEHVRSFLPEGITSKNVLVVSRIFAFDWAPKNCISFMMGRMFSWLRQNKPQIKFLLTYLNPNVCFSGTSYKASNWILFGREPGLKYAYLDGEYITLRALREKFNTSDLNYLKSLLQNRLEFSIQPLAPLRLYAYFLDKHLKNAWQEPIDFRKEPPIA